MAVPRPVQDWKNYKPDELEDSIARTRESLERHLEMLKDKLSPQAKLRRIGLPFAVAAAGLVAGGIVWKLTGSRRHRHHYAPEATVRRLKVRSAGIADHIRALRMLVGIIRKGKPGIFIVEPGKR